MAITTNSEMLLALQSGLEHFCPVCRSHDIHSERLDAISNSHAEQDSICGNCGAQWALKYEFTEIINLQSDEKLMGPTTLRAKYDGVQGTEWGQHPDHPFASWQAECASGDTRAGYWEWVHGRIQEA